MSNENKTGLTTAKRDLPTLEELHFDIQEAYKNDKLNLLLNQPVPVKWIKQHPTAKKKNELGQEIPTDYIPVDKIEFMLTRIFQEWRIEVLREYVMFQSVGVTVRLHYRNPVTGAWQYHDGVGAVAVQTNKGKSAADLAEIKSAAVMIALPAAKSYAFKDAAENLGRLFGKDLNRKDTLAFAGLYNEKEETDLSNTAQAIKDARNNQ